MAAKSHDKRKRPCYGPQYLRTARNKTTRINREIEMNDARPKTPARDRYRGHLITCLGKIKLKKS